MGSSQREVRISVGIVLLTCWLHVTVAANVKDATSSQTLIPRDDVKKYYEVMEKMDDKLGDLFGALVDRFGDKDAYTPDQVQYPIGPKKSENDIQYTRDSKRPSEVPRGAYSSDLAHNVLRIHALRTGSKDDLVKALIERYGYIENGVKKDQPWYRAREVRDIEDNGTKIGKVDQVPPRAARRTGFQPIEEGIRRFKIRQSWSDLLYTEDPSLGGTSKPKIDDLVGASFSFSHSFDTDRNNWSAVGALIFPFEWDNPVERNGVPEQVVLAPSISVNRVTNVDPKKEIDELYYRLGAIAKWVGPEGYLDIIQLRGAGIYGTDTENEARLPAYEVEFEPQITWALPNQDNSNNILTKYFKIGYANILVPKEPEHKDELDESVLDYQVRIWLRAEGGDLQQAGTNWNVVKGSFDRIGPSVQLRLNAPTTLRGVSLTALYSYMASLKGRNDHNSLLRIDGTLTLKSDPVSHQKISLNANYTLGGLDFTKQYADTFTLGLSVLF